MVESKPPPYTAAWVPDRDGQDWEAGIDLAAKWFEEQCAGRRGVLVTAGRQSESYDETITLLARRHHAVTPRSQRDAPRGVPVIAFVPDDRELSLAADFAGRSALVVIEAASSPVLGWAATVQAVDLTRPDEPAAVLAPLIVEAVQDLHFHGNNGFSNPYGRDAATRELQTLQAAGLVDADVLATALIGAGRRERQATDLRKLIEKLGLA